MEKSRANLYGAFGAILILAVFALSVMVTLLGGVSVYQRLIARNQQAYEYRTTSQYFAGKLHQAPEGVRVDRFGAGEALVIAQQLDGETYQTWVYCHDGWLMELFCLPNSGLQPQDGERILPLDGFDATLQDGLVKIQWVNGQGEAQQLIHAGRQEGMP